LLHSQAASDLEGNVANVAALMEHPVFDITNPQACEHLLWGFAASVPNFHEEGGSGYAFMVDAILKVRCKLYSDMSYHSDRT
jgi:aminopeptidase N